MSRLFRTVAHPDDLTEAAAIAFCTAGNPANNTVYQRASVIRSFLRWANRNGHANNPVADSLAGPDCPLRSYKRTYGKVQGKYPARWLSYDDAYGCLVPACQDGTLTGLRDELIIRLGLSGLRVAEIAALSVANASQLPAIHWTGKRHTPRRIAAGPNLSRGLARWLDSYDQPCPNAPLLCRRAPGPSDPDRIRWHHLLSASQVAKVITSRAADAGLGYVAPHDLRRSAAGILHHDTTPDGAHRYDLLDIQRVLGHADPATTMKSYLAPLDTEVLRRAGMTLD